MGHFDGTLLLYLWYASTYLNEVSCTVENSSCVLEKMRCGKYSVSGEAGGMKQG